MAERLPEEIAPYVGYKAHLTLSGRLWGMIMAQETWILVLIVIAFACIAFYAYLGLIFFWRFSPYLFGLVFGVYPILLLLGGEPIVETPTVAALNYFEAILVGCIISLIFHPEIKTRFFGIVLPEGPNQARDATD